MKERLKPLKPEEVIRALGRDGWYSVKSKGGHRNLRHPSKPGRVTIPVHGGRELDVWLLHRIIAQAGLKVEEFERLL